MINTDNTITYTPNANFNGTDSFTYTIDDGNGGSDTATVTVTVDPAAGGFELLVDFGTSGSPIEPGYTRITDTDAYSAGTGLGWQAGATQIGSLERSTGTDLTRDLVFVQLGTFLVDLATPGDYEITLHIGDTLNAHEQMGIFLEGSQVDTVTTAAGQVLTMTYAVNVTDGQLDVLLDDLGGANAFVTLVGLEVRTVPDRGSRVISATPSGVVNGPIDRVTLTFSEEVDAASFTLADVVSLSGPSGAITPLAINQNSATEFDVTFAAQTAVGAYGLTIGPDILDTTGNAMDQDQDLINGETPDDQFTANFDIEPFELLVDFGTSASPIEPGFNRVTDTDLYSGATGYGWQAAASGSLERFNGTALTRDLVYLDLGSFLVDVPTSGTYEVVVHIGDTLNAHELMGVFLEGNQVDTVTTAAGEVLTKTYVVNVTDGQLTLLLDDLGGVNAFVTLVGLEVRPAVGGPPVATDDAVTTDEDVAVIIDVLANDNDPDNDPLTVTSATQGTDGTVVVNTDNTVTYTPNANFNGSDSFTYTIDDGAGGSDTATVMVTIDSVNDDPVALDDAYGMDQGQSLTVSAGAGVLANDSDIDGGALTASVLVDPANGTVALAADGSFVYTPEVAFSGDDTFTYQVSDGVGGLATALVTITVDPPFTIGGDPRVDPANFRITVFATGLDYPYGMVQLSDGSILVGTSVPDSSSFFSSTGELVRLADDDGNGVADGPGTVLFTGLPGAMTSLVAVGELFFVTSSEGGGERITVLRAGATPDAALTLVGSLDFTFPAGFEHKSFGSAVWEASTGEYDLYFNLGAKVNEFNTTETVPVSGLITGTLNGDSIYRVRISDAAGVVTASNLEQIATGLRNAAGLAFDPVTGDLYFEDNGIDTPGNRGEALSADELNFIAAADLGGAIEDFGFAANYTEYRTGTIIGGQGIQPLAAFQPLPDPQTGDESEGPAEIALAPSTFGALSGGIFVGFHGQFNNGGLANRENPLVWVDPATGDYFHFIDIDQANIGHLDGLLSTSDSLFLADLSSNGSTGSGAGAGVIYMIQSIAAPPNNDPTAVDDATTTNEDVAVIIDVLANDNDSDGDPLTVASATQGVNGTVVVNADNTITYTPETGFTGTDYFSYDVSDGAGGSATALVTIMVDPPFAIGGDPRVDPADFRITVFASGLNFPNAMVELSDGSILVATAGAGSFFSTPGQLLRLTDVDNDGVADGPGTVLYTGLNPGLTSLSHVGDLFFATSAGSQITVLRAGATAADPLTLVGAIDFTFPPGWSHTTFANTARETPGAPGFYDLFFNIGSEVNFALSSGTVTVSGLYNDSFTSASEFDSIHMVTFDDTGAGFVFDSSIQIATGLRNAAGMAFDPSTGDFYLTENGIDTPGNGGESFSADELNIIALADIGGAIENFGYPTTYTEYRTGNVVGSTGIQPFITFNPQPDPATGSESEGAVELAFAPSAFPDGLDNGVFIGFHGEGGQAGLDNAENPVVYVDLATGEYFHFIENTEPTIGFPDSLLSTFDALFIADLSSNGSLGSSGVGAGVIYMIQSIAVPGNNDPTAVDDSATTDEDTPITIAVLTNDSDPDSDPLTVIAVTQGADGTVAINGDGTVDYTPSANFNGADTFTYTIGDGAGGMATATVDVTIDPVNDPPTAVDDDGVTTDEDTPVTISVLGNDSDVDGDPITVTEVTQGANGTVVINTDGTVDYTPDPGFNGTDTFTYTISDGADVTQSVMYRLDIDNTWSEATHPGLFPTDAHFSWLGGAIHNDAVSFWNEGEVASPGTVEMAETGATFILIDDEVGAAIIGGTALEAINEMHWFCPDGTTHASCGSTEVFFNADVAFPLVTTATMLGPSPDWFVGTNGLSLMQDGHWLSQIVVDLRPYDGGTRSANVFALFGPQNNPPEPISLITTASGQLVGPDSLGTMTFTLLSAPTTLASSSTATVTVTVGLGNSDPAAVDDDAFTDEDTPVTIDVLANDTDPNSDPLTVTAVTQGANGTVAINVDDTVTYTPNAGFDGLDSFTYTIDDGAGGSDTATVSVTVANVITAGGFVFKASVIDLGGSIGTTDNRFVALDVGDLDNDGDLDIVAGRSRTNGVLDDRVQVLLGNGDGTFGPATEFTAGRLPSSDVVADVNKDGILDVLTTDVSDDTVSLLLGIGDGTFAPRVVFAAGDAPDSLAVGDLDKDGNLDFVTANLNSDDVTVYFGDGAGGFGDRIDIAVGDRPGFTNNAVAIADLDKDGNLDIISGNSNDESLTILFGNGARSLVTVRDDIFLGDGTVRSLEIIDVNADGNLDILAAGHVGSAAGVVNVLLGAGTRTNGAWDFSTMPDVPMLETTMTTFAVDMNGDGVLDLVNQSFGPVSPVTGNVSVALGIGDGTFAPRADFSVGFNSSDLAVGDLDGDGDFDVVTSNYDGTLTVGLLEDAPPEVLSASPSGPVVGAVDRVTLSFNELIAAGSFTLADVVALTGPSGPITPLAVNALSATDFEVTFASQTAVGAYSLTIGPNILDAAGAPMSQPHTADFEITPFEALFDFGTSGSPLQTGYAQVTDTDAYSSAAGFGWQAGATQIGSLERAAGTNLTRDMVYLQLGTFLVDVVAAGNYEIMLHIGDTLNAHEQMGVFLEGNQVDSVTTVAGEVVTKTYTVAVNDGQLNVLFDDLGGANAFVTVLGIEVRQTTTLQLSPPQLLQASQDGTSSSFTAPAPTPQHDAFFMALDGGFSAPSSESDQRDVFEREVLDPIAEAKAFESTESDQAESDDAKRLTFVEHRAHGRIGRGARITTMADAIDALFADEID